MMEQVKDAITSFGEIVSGTVSSPSSRNFLNIIEEDKKLTEEMRDIFNSVTEKLRYLGKRAQPNIETKIDFLRTRVDRSDVDDQKKLKRVITWLLKTINDTRIIGCDNLDSLFIWVNESYEILYSMRIHTGVCISMGWGMIHAKHGKKQLNTKRSIEEEVVVLSDYLPYNIRLVSFMKEKGYEFNINKLYQ